MDVLKDAFEAMSQRIRSPIVGSIVLSFLVINWKAVAYLLFADHPLLVRFAFWDGNTNADSLVTQPLVYGLIVAFLLPWTKLAGAWIAQVPTRWLRMLQSENSRKLRIRDAKGQMQEDTTIAQLRAQREESEINAELRLQKAQDLSPTLGARLSAQRRNEDTEYETKELQLFDLVLSLYKGPDIYTTLLKDREGTGRLQLEPDNADVYSYFLSDEQDPIASKNQFEHSRIQTSLEVIESNGLIERVAGDANATGKYYRLTELGNTVGVAFENPNTSAA